MSSLVTFYQALCCALDVGEKQKQTKPIPVGHLWLFSHRFIVMSIILVHIGFLQGCYSYKIVVPKDDPATHAPTKKTVTSYFWGFAKPTIKPCVESNKINDVQVTTNVGYMLITIVTLGIVAPVQVEYHCSPTPQIEGGDSNEREQ